MCRGFEPDRAAHGVGAIAGPSLVALAVWHLLMPLYVAVALALFIAVMVARYLVEPTKHAAMARPRNLARLGYFDSRYRHLLLVGVVIYLGMAVSTQMMGFYLPYVLGLDVSKSATFLGLAQALMAGATVFGQLVLVQRLSWSPLKLLKVGMPLMAGRICATGQFYWSGTVFCIGAMLLGLGLGICGPGSSAAVSLSVIWMTGCCSRLSCGLPCSRLCAGAVWGGHVDEWHPRAPFVLVVLLLLAIWLILFRKRT